MLIPKSEFVGLEGMTHLATGGESPMLKSHKAAIERFFEDKVHGEESRALMESVYQSCRAKVAQMWSVSSEEIAFLSSSSEGINLVSRALDWQAGDNVVVSDVEFPSDVLPWTWLEEKGVEIRIVRHQEWQIDIESIAAQINERTRVVAISYVSYFTGQRQNLPALSAVVRASNALLLLDVTHASGAVPVEAHYADIVVCSCYKWLLAVHGVGIFYWNRQRLPDLKPPFVGWNTGMALPSWESPTSFTLRADANRFLPGNPNFLGIYVLDNALDYLLTLGLDTIERYVLTLSGQLREGLHEAGWEVMTPRAPEERAGNICFIAPNVEAIVTGLAARGILIWGGYGGVKRVRVSTHLYNEAADVAHFLTVLKTI